MSDFIDKLRAVVGDKGLILDEKDKHPFLTDWRENYLGAALAGAPLACPALPCPALPCPALAGPAPLCPADTWPAAA